MADKKAFVFDTNFIIENKKHLEEVVKNLSTDFNVYVTQVSIDERIAQNCRESKEKFDKVEECIKKHSDIADVTMRKTYEEICAGFQADTPKAYKKIFAKNIIPYDKDAAMFLKVLDRAYKKTPPFPMHDKSDHGFKDTVLWLSLIKYFKDNGENKIVFVTEDNGFGKNQEVLIEEFEKETHKSIKIMPNSYYEELLKAEKDEPAAKKSKPLPDFTSLRDRVHNTIYDLCFVVSPDYWGNEAEEPIFLISRTVDELDIGLFFSGLEKIINNHILQKSVLTEEVFDAIDGTSPVMHTVPIGVLEQALRLYEEIKEKYPEYVNQFYSAVVSMFNRNYVNPENTVNPDDELPF